MVEHGKMILHPSALIIIPLAVRGYLVSDLPLEMQNAGIFQPAHLHIQSLLTVRRWRISPQPRWRAYHHLQSRLLAHPMVLRPRSTGTLGMAARYQQKVLKYTPSLKQERNTMYL